MIDELTEIDNAQFTLTQAAYALGITVGVIIGWHNKGIKVFGEGDIRRGGGRGRAHRVSRKTIYKWGIATRLNKFNVPKSEAWKVATTYFDCPKEDYEDAIYLADDETSVAVHCSVLIPQIYRLLDTTPPK